MEEFTIVISLALIIFAVIYFVRWWKMADDIRAIREQLAPFGTSDNFSHLMLLGRKEQAREAVIKQLISRLMFCLMSKSQNKDAEMSGHIESCRQFLGRYGMELPPELSSVESFKAVMQLAPPAKAK